MSLAQVLHKANKYCIEKFLQLKLKSVVRFNVYKTLYEWSVMEAYRKIHFFDSLIYGIFLGVSGHLLRLYILVLNCSWVQVKF